MSNTYLQNAVNKANGMITAGKARSNDNTAGRVWKGAGGNIMTPSHRVSMGHGSNRNITHSPTTRSGISNYFTF